MKTHFQSQLSEAITGFLSYKRALGRSYETEEYALRLFDRYLAEHSITELDGVTPELLDAFLASRRRASPRSYNHLLGVLRRLFNWLLNQGHLNQSPLCDRPRRETGQRVPFLFDKELARKLLEVASTLPDNPYALLRGPTYHMIFALLYGLGLRVGEVSRLCRKDVDLQRNLLIIRQTKFSKSRLVPFGPCMAESLRQYIKCREKKIGGFEANDPFFSFRKCPINRHTISRTLHSILRLIGVEVQEGVAPPCPHSLRHSFAVGTLLRWYREQKDPAQYLLHLSTFMGHVSPDSTSVYLTITGDMLTEASKRFAQFSAQLTKEVEL
ncbi:MAG: site-specific integrase [Desulfobulbaceae bacterium]|nr:site-specific integrase [Desulfobulbaceae bacterium]